MFIEDKAVWLTAGRSEKFTHRFGGACRYRCVRPRGSSHAVHMLYDLDLTDTRLPIIKFFSGLRRLPLLIAQQFDCSDMIYRVMTGSQIKIVWMYKAVNNWASDFPYENYPQQYKRHPITARKLTPNDRYWASNVPATLKKHQLGDYKSWVRKHFYTPRIGGVYELIQGESEWDCRTRKCPYSGKESTAGKLTFMVLWEQPVPDVNLWERVPKPEMHFFQCIQIVFSLCVGCSAIHSCNRCD